MAYFFSKVLNTTFEDALERATLGLQKEGFGILTEIDVKATMKKKLNEDYPNYKILGACNPPFAHRALQVDPLIGTMLPCNVVVRELPEASVEVAAVDPVASMQAVQNPRLGTIAREVQAKLRRVIDNL